MAKVIKTSKGSELPLISLKGKDYLMVAYRLQWLSDDVKRYSVTTELINVTDEQTVAKATVQLFNDDGTLLRQAQATKRETKKDFADHTEKAETAAIGRALGMLGFGTQHALADFDEGERLADSPLQSAKKPLQEAPKPANDASLASPPKAAEVPKERTTFRLPPKPESATLKI